MARSFLLRRSRPNAASEAEAPRIPRRAVPPPAELRRERRTLLRLREERIRDLGGLALEMYRRDAFRESLLFDHCAEVASIEERLRELDALLDARHPPAARCVCGAPLFWRAHFCGNCGRQLGEAGALSCRRCGRALPADARYCAACGATAPVQAAGASS
jgi:hypothetical protein